MSDGIELFSPCCNSSLCINKEGEKLKVKMTKDEFEIYDSSIPVFTCIKCKRKWAIERVVPKDAYTRGKEAIQRLREKF